MGTIEDIRYDRTYSHAAFRFLLLDNQCSNHTTLSSTIWLNHISLLTFVHVFDRLIACQRYIHDDPRKIITLCISDKSLIEWHDKINVTDDNIRRVHIFCYSFSDFLEMKKWTGCYQTRIKDVYLPDDFEYQLLNLGVDYIHRILPEFEEERTVRKKLCAHAQDLLRAMMNYYGDEMNKLDEEESVECS